MEMRKAKGVFQKQLCVKVHACPTLPCRLNSDLGAEMRERALDRAILR